MKDAEFALEVRRIIDLIAERVEQQDPAGMIDIDINGSILNITTDKGVFVINKQTATQEIWLSSPVSGPYHFALQDNYWKSRTGAELFTTLSQELQIEINE